MGLGLFLVGNGKCIGIACAAELTESIVLMLIILMSLLRAYLFLVPIPWRSNGIALWLAPLHYKQYHMMLELRCMYADSPTP